MRRRLLRYDLGLTTHESDTDNIKMFSAFGAEHSDLITDIPPRQVN